MGIFWDFWSGKRTFLHIRNATPVTTLHSHLGLNSGHGLTPCEGGVEFIHFGSFENFIGDSKEFRQ